ncbi:MAG: DUF2147 domain-containing protein [Hyphomicrobiaceae bacterium]
MSGVIRKSMRWQPLTIFAATVIGFALLSGAPVLAKQEIHGVWIDDSGKGAVEIRPCGRSMCGFIVWLKKSLSRTGKPLTDKLNPEPRRRGKPICGLQVIGRLKPQSDGSWDDGWIYDPNKGQAFDVEVKRRSAEFLQVKGYLGLKFLSETFVWKRAPNGIKRCSN